MNSLAIKPGATLHARHFDAVMAPIFVVVLEKSPKTEDDLVVVTSGSDSHDKGLHPNFRAIDVRTKNVVAPTILERRRLCSIWKDKIKERLGKDYDVRFETFIDAPDSDHIHIEYDEKG